MMHLRILSLLILFFTGCSLLTPRPRIPESPENPFTFEVKEENNDGKSLRVLLSLTARVAFFPKLVRVDLASLKNGDPIESRSVRLSTLIGSEEVLPEGKEIFVPISVSSQDMTDYQVSLFWGKEAEGEDESADPSLPQIHPSESSPPVPSVEGAPEVILQDLSIIEQKNLYQVSGILKNTGPSWITGVTLGVGFLWQVEEGTLPQSAATVPQLEEEVKLEGLRLPPEEIQPINIEFSRPSSNNGNRGHLIPTVRVKSAQ